MQPVHIGLVLYFIFAFLSLLFTSPHPLLGFPKLLGVGELCVLAAITADLASRPNSTTWIAYAIALTSIITAAAAVVGLLIFYLGEPSPLIGIYGELEPSRWYARVQAGTYNPNLLASFCIFAAAIVSSKRAELPRWVRRSALLALWITVLLTFSRGIFGFVLAALIRNATTPRRRAIAAMGAVTVAAVTIAITIWKPLINPVRPFDIGFEQVASSRKQAALSALATVVRKPLFGSGLGTSPGEYHGAPFDSHCTPINIAATIGLPALITFSFLIASLWRRRRPIDLALWGGLAGMAVDGLAQDIEDFRHLWVMIGLAGSSISLRTSERKE
jgi:O-antigen ligase/polysaccharide polymerase Wzy-like membrane protein